MTDPSSGPGLLRTLLPDPLKDPVPSIFRSARSVYGSKPSRILWLIEEESTASYPGCVRCAGLLISRRRADLHLKQDILSLQVRISRLVRRRITHDKLAGHAPESGIPANRGYCCRRCVGEKQKAGTRQRMWEGYSYSAVKKTGRILGCPGVCSWRANHPGQPRFPSRVAKRQAPETDEAFIHPS